MLAQGNRTHLVASKFYLGMQNERITVWVYLDMRIVSDHYSATMNVDVSLEKVRIYVSRINLTS
jgi:hypothetical protein